MADLRTEFEGILKDFGHNVLLIRSDTQLRCTTCWSDKTQEASRECPVCFGLGYVPIVEKHTVRVEDSSIAISYPDMAQGFKFGEMATPGFRYFMKHDAKVSIGDLIMEVEWTDSGKPVYNGGYLSSINHIDRKRWEGGQVIFQKVYTSDEPIEKEIRGIRIVNSNGIKNYEIVRGV